MSVMEYAQAARIVREEQVVKDKSYRRFPIGQEWGRFLRAKRLAGCAPNTLLSYETVGRMFALRFADFDSLEPFVDVELVLDFLDHHWGDSDPDTLDQRTNVMRSFSEWAWRTGRCSEDFMRRVEKRRRKKTGPQRARIPTGPLHRLLGGRHSDRDRCGLLLLGRLALRREDLRLLQIGDIDMGRDELYLRHVKGGGEDVLPIAWPEVRDALYLYLNTTDHSAAEYLIYPKTFRLKPMSRAGIALWFERRCDAAGVTGYTMHQLRHAAADDLRRATGSTADAQALLRHRDSKTTEQYLHTDVDDLRRAIQQLSSSDPHREGR